MWNLCPRVAVDKNQTIAGGSRWQAQRKAGHARALSARRGEGGDAPQAQVGRLSALFPEAEPENRPASQSRHLQDAGGGREARACRAVLQAPLKWRSEVGAWRNSSSWAIM